MKKMEFDYFNGMEAEQYSFYRIPKILFTEGCFKQLSCEAKVLYGLLLDRMGLSVKNQWIDEKNHVFIMFTVEDIMELLNCGKQKAVRCLAELDSEKGIGLIEKKRLGLGRPNVIYVKNFMQKGSKDQRPGHGWENEGRKAAESRTEDESGQKPGYGAGSRCSPEPEDSRKNEYRQEMGNDTGSGVSSEPVYRNEGENVSIMEQQDSSRFRQKWEDHFSADLGAEMQKITEPDMQGHENKILGSMKTEIQGTVESGQESENLNWWDMASTHQEIIGQDSAKEEKISAEKMPGMSLGLSGLFDDNRSPGSTVLEKPESDLQKYENHTSRSSKIILLEGEESCFNEYENQTSGDAGTKKEAEYAQNSQKYENHTSRSSKIILQEVPESYFSEYENHTSGSSRIILQEVPESYPNDTEYSETENNDTEMNKTEESEPDLSDTYTGLCDPVQSCQSYQSYQSNPASLSAGGKTAGLTDMGDKMDGYRSIIRDNIGYHCFETDRYYSIEDVDEFVELMVEVMAMPDGSSLRVSGAERPVSVVKSRFMKINKGHIEYVLGCLQNNTTKIGNIKAYLLTALYNATLTISNYYRAEVNHDMYGGGWNG